MSADVFMFYINISYTCNGGVWYFGLGLTSVKLAMVELTSPSWESLLFKARRVHRKKKKLIHRGIIFLFSCVWGCRCGGGMFRL